MIKGISSPLTRKNCHRGAYFGYRPFVNLNDLNNIDLDDLIKILQAEGMEVRRASHQPLHLLHLFKSSKNLSKINKVKSNVNKLYKKGDLPKAEKFYNSTISIPTFTFENKKLIDSYVKCFSKVFNILSNNKINSKKI